MAHSQSVKINTSIPSVADYGRRLGLSKSRQRDLIRLVNPDLAGEVRVSDHKVSFKPHPAKATIGKVVSRDKGTIMVQVSPQKSKVYAPPKRLMASDHFKLAGLGDKVRIIRTDLKPKSKLVKVSFDSAAPSKWTLDEVVARSNARGKSSKITAK